MLQPNLTSFDEQIHRYNIAISWIEQACPSSDGLSGLTILDIGCHNGVLCNQFARLKAQVFGIDIYDPSAQEVDKKLWTYFQRNLNQEKSLPFQDGSVSAITALEILEHIIDTDYFLKEILRVLKPGGVLIISTPNINMLKNRLRVPLGLYPYALEYHTIIHHVRLYNLPVLRRHLTDTGFQVVRYRGTHLIPQRLLYIKSLHSASDWLSKRLPNFSGDLMIMSRKPASTQSVSE